MPKYNRKCFYCGKEYYCCSSCVGINSWKNTHCSIDCFLKSQEENKESHPILINKEDKDVIVLRAGLKSGKTIDIIGYDLDLGKFDCADGTTKIFDDFSYFIVSSDEMKMFTLKNKTNKKVYKTTRTNKENEVQ